VAQQDGVYDHTMNDLAAFVLAGGKSTRMGADKAFLSWGTGTLLDHALKLAGTVADVRILGDAKKFASLGAVIEDLYANRGPLGGIHAALANSTSQWNLVIAVDLPFLVPRFLDYLISQARESGALVTVPRAGGGFQPLCAVYQREFARTAEQSLAEGQNKIDLLFAKVETRIIEEHELIRGGFSAEMFRNLNTPADWEQAKQGSIRKEKSE
jgi:molybdenum cofactor guanylyltransferase